jgi:hypothetical protein
VDLPDELGAGFPRPLNDSTTVLGNVEQAVVQP